MSLAEAFLYCGLEGRPYRQRMLSPGVQNSLIPNLTRLDRAYGSRVLAF